MKKISQRTWAIISLILIGIVITQSIVLISNQDDLQKTREISETCVDNLKISINQTLKLETLAKKLVEEIIKIKSEE